MKFRKVGHSGLQVSEITLGSWLTYGKTVEDNTAEKIIERAIELGINSFDCADIYERGAAETVRYPSGVHPPLDPRVGHICIPGSNG